MEILAKILTNEGYEWVRFNGGKKRHLAFHMYSNMPLYKSLCGIESYATPNDGAEKCKRCLKIAKARRRKVNE